jgi:hypothetical protein
MSWYVLVCIGMYWYVLVVLVVLVVFVVLRYS